MQRAFLSFFLLLLVGGLNVARATAAPTDTIVVRLPNQAVITLMVRDAAQLRQLKKYQLDSLTSRLATYITQAEAAAKASSASQVTMEFFPDKDRPGQNMPEQIRITTHKTANGTSAGTSNSKMDVLFDKVKTNSGMAIKIGGKSKDEIEKRELSRDSARQAAYEKHKVKSHLIFDLGLNVFANQHSSAPFSDVDLRTGGSRYVNLGLNWDARLGGKRSPLSLTAGPEFAFNSFMLSGNNKWTDVNGQTLVVRETNGNQYQKSKLGTSSVNLPLMLRLQLHDTHYKPTFKLAAGGFAGYRLKSWTKLKYTTEGTTYKDKQDGSYNMENFQYGVQGTIGYGSLEFFGKYNLNNVFKTGAGPDLQVVSFGLRLAGID